MAEGDFDKYFDDLKEETGRDHRWLASAASILGVCFVLESLNPKGPTERPFLSKPRKVRNISVESFKNILKMDVSVERYSYIYTEKELGVFKQLKEELMHYSRLEDSRSIENTALSWMKQKNRMLSDFGSLEGSKMGFLDVYSLVDGQGFKVLIPWSATGDNPCRECIELDGMLFDPEEFPDPPHFGCQCNDPMANPVLVF